jgi:hypothetical protein
MLSKKNKDNLRKISIHVFSAHDTSDIKTKSILISSFNDYDKIIMGFGVHLFNVGDMHQIYVENDGWNNARVLQLTSNPTRVIFITSDVRQLIVPINLDFPNAHANVRMLQQQNNSRPCPSNIVTINRVFQSHVVELQDMFDSLDVRTSILPIHTISELVNILHDSSVNENETPENP